MGFFYLTPRLACNLLESLSRFSVYLFNLTEKRETAHVLQVAIIGGCEIFVSVLVTNKRDVCCPVIETKTPGATWGVRVSVQQSTRCTAARTGKTETRREMQFGFTWDPLTL